VEEQPRAWYAAGLYRRIQEARRWRPQPVPRKPWRERLRERGLHWSLEIVVGIFVAVVAASMATVALGSSGPTGLSHLQESVGGAAAPVTAPPTPDCIAAPIAGSARRVCTVP
jgi:hypothetical protein